MRTKSKTTGENQDNPKPAKRIGRPSDYSPELAAEICDRIAGVKPADDLQGR